MFRLLILLSLYITCLFGFGAANVQAASPETLVTINDQMYTQDDFLSWWEKWKEKDAVFPGTPTLFVNWHLLVDDALSLELNKEKSYLRKLDVFLKARTLMLLKREEIDSKIEITDREVKEFFKQKYLPAWYIAVIRFKVHSDAQDFISDLKEKKNSLDSALKDFSHRGVVFTLDKRWFNVSNVPSEFKSSLVDAEEFSLIRPESLDEDNVVLYLLESRDDDYSTLPQKDRRIRNLIRKEKTKILTANLVERLKEKFNVRIDQEIYEAIDVHGDNRHIANKTLISSDYLNMTVASFEREYNDYRKKRITKIEDSNSIKTNRRWFLNTLIANLLTSWESLDRHYEQKSPFKEHFEFYQQHRLIKELEKKFITNDLHINEPEIAQYYKDNTVEFTLPAKVKYSLIRGKERDIKKIWVDGLNGKDFIESVIARGVKDIRSEHIELTKLPSTIFDAIEKLAVNEVSSPFKIQDEYALVKLLDRTNRNTLPLEHVTRRVKEKLYRQKIKQSTDDYIKKIKANSSIILNEAAWKELKKSSLEPL